jgi:hypothetical protein
MYQKAVAAESNAASAARFVYVVFCSNTFLIGADIDRPNQDRPYPARVSQAFGICRIGISCNGHTESITARTKFCEGRGTCVYVGHR